MVDSIRKIDDDNSYGIDMKSYALAKIAEKNNRLHLRLSF